MQDYDTIVGVYSKKDAIYNKLSERLIEKEIEIKDINLKANDDFTKISYLIINLYEDTSLIKDLKDIIKGVECKIIIILPLFVDPKEKYIIEVGIKDILQINSNVGFLLAPEILGSDVTFHKEYISHNLISQSLTSERIKTGDDVLVNTISVGKLVERIIKETFSFGVSGKKLALIGPRIGQKTFATKYLGFNRSDIISQNTNGSLLELDYDDASLVDYSVNLAVKKTKENFSSIFSHQPKEENNNNNEVLVPSKNVLPETKVYKRSNKVKLLLSLFLKLVLAILTVLLIPFFSLVVSIILLFFSSKNIISNQQLAKKIIAPAVAFAKVPTELSFGYPFYYDAGNILIKTASLESEVISITSSTSHLLGGILGQENYNPAPIIEEISSGIDKIHTQTSFLQSDLLELNGYVGRLVNSKLLSKNIKIDEYKDRVYSLKSIVSRSAELLGVNKPKKYLILFQNNMELRPTGGFIGSFALVTFDKGRMSEVVVNDIYSADGQLKGHVDPPAPINNYLGEGGWYMRDSNWDPDFIKSSEKIEWFLDKEIGQNVDGVIAVDLSFVKNLLSVMGPISLTDFNVTVNSENLYMTTQKEVEDDFFPGSIKKASFLTSLSKTLINDLESLPKEKYLGVMLEVYRSLEEKHILVALHDEYSQSAISDLGYSGEIAIPTECSLKCLKDGYLYNDANLGVNKANLYIERSYNLNITPNKDNISHELVVEYKNSASTVIGKSGVYKTYSRIILPKDSSVVGVRSYDEAGNYENISFDETSSDYKEVGFLLQILPSSTKKVQIVWSTPTKNLSSGGEYSLKILKQPGTNEDPIKINILNADLSLTGNSLPVYNTVLRKDIDLKLYFK